jgi:hypothetical protein
VSPAPARLFLCCLRGWCYGTTSCRHSSNPFQEHTDLQSSLNPSCANLQRHCLPAAPHPRHLACSLAPADDQVDAGVVVKAWLKRFGLSRKPKYIFGISSGASFAIKFPKTMYVEGVISGELAARRVCVRLCLEEHLQQVHSRAATVRFLVQSIPLCLSGFFLRQRSTCLGRRLGA